MLNTFTKVALGLVASVSAAAKPGINVGITEAGLNSGKNAITPYIFKFLNNFTLPEVDFSGGKLTNIVLNLPTPAVENIDFKMQPANNGLEMTAQKLDAHMIADF